MDEEIIELEEEFEKVDVDKAKAESGDAPRKARPVFRIMQPDKDRDGKPILREVGVVWKQVGKNGNEFYVVKIGDLRLLM